MAPPSLAVNIKALDLAALAPAALVDPGHAIANASTTLAAEHGGAFNTWKSRIRRCQESDPAGYAAALAGSPHTGEVRRYILTAAQDNTPVHGPFWANLLAFAAHVGAEVIVGGFTYQKGLFEDHAARSAVFATDVQPYLRHDRVDLGPIDFCAEMNILPTAARPLSGLETYTGAKWGVFPHAKVQLVSVPTLLVGQPKIIMTTGAVTVQNYLPKKAGQKAVFHHVQGATLVEIDASGLPFCRQINATADGAFQDLDLQVRDGVVTGGHRVECITWGDIHREKIDPAIALACWGLDVETDTIVAPGMIDVLRPRHQIMHDLLDFEARNHHRIHDHHHRFRMIKRGTDSVADGIAASASFLRLTERDFCQTAVVPSNHHDALTRWLVESDFREDAANALVYLRCTTAIYEAMDRGDEGFDVFKWALQRADPTGLPGIIFVPRNGSYIICQGAGGIECAVHGHQGPNGSRGSPNAFTRVATKMITGHTHVAGILDGVYTAGLSGLFDQGYNDGASSWSQTHVVTYPNGRRTLLTMHGRRWRA